MQDEGLEPLELEEEAGGLITALKWLSAAVAVAIVLVVGFDWLPFGEGTTTADVTERVRLALAQEGHPYAPVTCIRVGSEYECLADFGPGGRQMLTVKCEGERCLLYGRLLAAP